MLPEGFRHSKESLLKMSLSHTGKIPSLETRQKISLAQKGRIFSEEQRRNMSLAGRGRVFSAEHRRKISLVQKGRFFSEEHRRHLSLAQIGDKNNHWQGGISFVLYGEEFNRDLKNKVRTRDNFTCRFPFCGKQETGKFHHVHHIDYDKRNNILSNLITLCPQHHAKTNTHRKRWTEVLKSTVLENGNAAEETRI